MARGNNDNPIGITIYESRKNFPIIGPGGPIIGPGGSIIGPGHLFLYCEVIFFCQTAQVHLPLQFTSLSRYQPLFLSFGEVGPEEMDQKSRSRSRFCSFCIQNL